MENLFEKAENLANEGKYELLDKLVSEMEAIGCLHPELLILKARCIQTTDSPLSADLQDVEKTLETAIVLDKTFFPALVELGYLKLNVLDDAKGAIPLFDKAIEIINKIATEAIIGRALCEAEINSKEQALAFIEKAKDRIIEPEKMDAFLEDVDFYAS